MAAGAFLLVAPRLSIAVPVPIALERTFFGRKDPDTDKF